jgi:hypothetical protein
MLAQQESGFMMNGGQEQALFFGDLRESVNSP